MKKRTISILGCGWLGLPLLKSLVADGYAVKGSARNPKTLAAITAAGGEAFYIDLPGEIPPAFLEDCSQLIWTIPPKTRSLGDQAWPIFFKSLGTLLSWLNEPWHNKRFIFLSSTGVYGEAEGVMTEESFGKNHSTSGKILASAEYRLRQNYVSPDILRLAGLVGPDRHPGCFYGGRDRFIPNADAPVNLVHQEDVIAAIKVIMNEHDPDIYNVCSAAHPNKGDFYTRAAKAIGLEVKGTEAGGAGGKIINSDKLRARGWTPVWDDLNLAFLNEPI